ncbi:hypothetical protein [Yersinia kristensenii]|uniref:hypothetical protein n=1 Tax=Yersinia kristensenii TaxID=28152 RepID=UPI000C14B96E|nr:hypothetical protein [Yersinia kristensenii]MDA5524561.1 hypothetical protein [Yersinia kristensenii]MDR4896593.1 hypothetical protein [Yersinia kristensenii]MDX6737287.1 hypothetical protein [Yersinia kristensenii]PHZ35535.1 hypothetical protein CS536_12590 [Yersinia kristensenii]
MLAKIFPCQPAEPGTAQLMIRLRGEQVVLSNLTFSLCNNEQNYLQPDSSWSPAPHWFTIDGGYPFNNDSGFHIGPTLIDPLLASASQVQIQIRLASGETRSTTLQLVRDELFSSDARGQTGDYSGSSVLTTPAPVPTPEPVAVAEPMPTPAEPTPAAIPPQPKRNTSLIPMIAAGLLVLLIAAGALWWFMGRDSASTQPTTVDKQPEAPAIAAAPEATSDASECSPANLANQSELDFVQNCVQQKLDSDKLLTIIQAAKDTKKCGVAQRLYANRAQGGDIKIALAYASEYDPQNHKPSECFKTADPDTATYWYETVLQTDPDNQKAKQRLEELRK